jgi:hypothetical protein
LAGRREGFACEAGKSFLPGRTGRREERFCFWREEGKIFACEAGKSFFAGKDGKDLCFYSTGNMVNRWQQKFMNSAMVRKRTNDGKK